MVTRARELAPSYVSAFFPHDILWAYVALLTAFFILHCLQAPPFLPVYHDRAGYRLLGWTLAFLEVVYIPTVFWISEAYFVPECEVFMFHARVRYEILT